MEEHITAQTSYLRIPRISTPRVHQHNLLISHLPQLVDITFAVDAIPSLCFYLNVIYSRILNFILRVRMRLRTFYVPPLTKLVFASPNKYIYANFANA